MILPFPIGNTPAAQPDLTDVRDTLLMLSLTCAMIASPKLPIDRAREAARLAQKTAEAYAEVVTGLIEQGGAQ
jgi:hypothetical protein